MIDFESLRKTVTSGLEKYLGCTVRRSNQNKKPPAYPYVSYTVTAPKNVKKGSYGVYEDGFNRKSVTQTWSISVLSDNNDESVELAFKANEWLDHVGTTYLYDNNVRVQSVGSITNRDNVLTIEYEYKNGFDVVFSLEDVVKNPDEEAGYIEKISINGQVVEYKPSAEEILQEELDEANRIIQDQTNALTRLSKRLEGVDSGE